VFAWFMGLKTISPAALHERIQSGPLAVFDVNARSSWIAARVPGARNLDPVHYEATDLPTDKSAEMVFYCSNPMCRKAPNAARRAKQLGFTNPLVMSAGISGWLASNLPTESGE